MQADPPCPVKRRYLLTLQVEQILRFGFCRAARPAAIRYDWHQPPAEMQARVCDVAPTLSRRSGRLGDVAPSLRQRVGRQPCQLVSMSSPSHSDRPVLLKCHVAVSSLLCADHGVTGQLKTDKTRN